MCLLKSSSQVYLENICSLCKVVKTLIIKRLLTFLSSFYILSHPTRDGVALISLLVTMSVNIENTLNIGAQVPEQTAQIKLTQIQKRLGLQCLALSHSV